MCFYSNHYLKVRCIFICRPQVLWNASDPHKATIEKVMNYSKQWQWKLKIFYYLSKLLWESNQSLKYIWAMWQIFKLVLLKRNISKNRQKILGFKYCINHELLERTQDPQKQINQDQFLPYSAAFGKYGASCFPIIISVHKNKFTVWSQEFSWGPNTFFFCSMARKCGN